MAGGARCDVATAALSIQRVLTVRTQPPLKAELVFDPALSAADQDLTQLSERLASVGEMAVSFCLYRLERPATSATTADPGRCESCNP